MKGQPALPDQLLKQPLAVRQPGHGECDNIVTRGGIVDEGNGPDWLPHIVNVERVCRDAAATIEGTRIAVWHTVDFYNKVGMSVEEILAESEYLIPAQVFTALAYYRDNREEIDQVFNRTGTSSG